MLFPEREEFSVPRNSSSDELLDVVETLLKAQLSAVRKIKRQAGQDAGSEESSTDEKRMSQTDMAEAVLKKAGKPLHILEIIKRIEADFGRPVNRDSLVSAVLKKVNQRRQFAKTGKNMYGLLGRDELP
jgi:hypothetical protein